MLKWNSSGDGYPTNWARSCDICHAAPCTLYCHTDSAYLCQGCDEYTHAANPSALQHERVWICTTCENASAAFTCQADAANLCVDCDTEIHLANPLARRHNRTPIPPISGVVHTSLATYQEELQGQQLDTENDGVASKRKDNLEDETDSWLLPDLDSNNDNQTQSGFTYGEDVDEYLHLIHCNSCTELCHNQNDQQQLSSVHQGESGNDDVVPVQSFEAKDQQDHHHHQQQLQNVFVDSGYEASKAAFINTNSSKQKVPVYFMDAGYILKSNNPNSYHRFPDPSLLMPLQFTPMNREEKVLRYREKRKARKFEKKIIYAARKVNAQNRPRINGRFTRKRDMEIEVNDQMFPTEDYGYGIFPSYQVK